MSGIQIWYEFSIYHHLTRRAYYYGDEIPDQVVCISSLTPLNINTLHCSFLLSCPENTWLASATRRSRDQHQPSVEVLPSQAMSRLFYKSYYSTDSNILMYCFINQIFAINKSENVYNAVVRKLGCFLLEIKQFSLHHASLPEKLKYHFLPFSPPLIVQYIIRAAR